MPACHAGDRRFESGRVRHLRISLRPVRPPGRGVLFVLAVDGCRAWTTLDCVAGLRSSLTGTLSCARSGARPRLASVAHPRRTQSRCADCRAWTNAVAALPRAVTMTGCHNRRREATPPLVDCARRAGCRHRPDGRRQARRVARRRRRARAASIGEVPSGAIPTARTRDACPTRLASARLGRAADPDADPDRRRPDRAGHPVPDHARPNRSGRGQGRPRGNEQDLRRPGARRIRRRRDPRRGRGASDRPMRRGSSSPRTPRRWPPTSRQNRKRLAFLRADAVGPSVRALGWGDRRLFGVGAVETVEAWGLTAELPGAVASLRSGRLPGRSWRAATSCSTAVSPRRSRSTRRASTSRSTVAPPTSPSRCKDCSSLRLGPAAGQADRQRRARSAALINGADLAIANFENPAPEQVPLPHVGDAPSRPTRP